LTIKESRIEQQWSTNLAF